MTSQFPQRERIKAQKHFDSLFQQAKKIHADYFVICYSDKQLEDRAFAFIASKKVGGAVQRNKAKRKLREIFRKHQQSINRTVDMIVIAKKACVEAKLDQIETAFIIGLQERDLWLN